MYQSGTLTNRFHRLSHDRSDPDGAKSVDAKMPQWFNVDSKQVVGMGSNSMESQGSMSNKAAAAVSYKSSMPFSSLWDAPDKRNGALSEFTGLIEPKFSDTVMEKSYQQYISEKIQKYSGRATLLGVVLFFYAPMSRYTLGDVARWVHVTASVSSSVACATYSCAFQWFSKRVSLWYDLLMFIIGLVCQGLAGLNQRRLSVLLGEDNKGVTEDVLLEVLALLFSGGIISACGFYVQKTCKYVIYVELSALVLNAVSALALDDFRPSSPRTTVFSFCLSNGEILMVAVVVYFISRQTGIQDRQFFMFEHARNMMKKDAEEREHMRSLLRHVKEEEELATEALLEDGAGGHAFRFGDRVRVIKEARTKGKTAKVIQPHWNGLVKVKMDEEDQKGNIKSYKPNDLELIVDRPTTTEGAKIAKIVVATRESNESRELTAPLPPIDERKMSDERKSTYELADRRSGPGVEYSPNGLFRSVMTGQKADWSKIRAMAEQIDKDSYSTLHFFEDCIASFPELQLFLLDRDESGMSSGSGKTSSGRSGEAEYQRTVGALFAVYWLLRLEKDGRRGFSFGVDGQWKILAVPPISAERSDNPDDPTGGVSDPLLLFGRPWSQLSADEKRWCFHWCTDWAMFTRLAKESGCIGRGPQVVERRMALLCLTAFHDIMKCDDMLPMVHPDHAPYLGYASGIQIRDHDVALSYVMQHYPELLPSFAGLPEEQKTALLFTQGKMQFNHGHFVQAEAPPGVMLRKFKEEIRSGASGSDIALYFMHWLTDLAGAEATPRGGAEKFVLKFPHAVLSSFLWSIPYLQNLAEEEETAVVESYLHARWKAVAPNNPLPEDAFTIACMRLAVMSHGDHSVVSAFHEQEKADKALLAHELALTGAEGQNFSTAMGSTGGPALLVYYGPALLQRNVKCFEDLTLALWVLCQVLRAARRLWPLWVEMQGSTVTVQIAELKSLDMQQLCCGIRPAKKVWVLVRHNDCEAAVEQKDLHQLNALMHEDTKFHHLDFSPDAERDEDISGIEKSLQMSEAIMACRGRESASGTHLQSQLEGSKVGQAEPNSAEIKNQISV
jgi:hypothetical protein